MNEIVDIKLDGTLCQRCGLFLGPTDDPEITQWEPCGYPKECDDCNDDK